jgi:hypothetical protein
LTSIELFDNKLSAEDEAYIFEGLKKGKGKIQVSFGEEDKDRIVAEILKMR